MSAADDPRTGSRIEDPATHKALDEVRRQRARLSRLMNTHDAARLVIGLLYLSRTTGTASGSSGPTWPWLLAQTTKADAPIGAGASACFAHWLAASDTEDGDAGAGYPMPVPPRGADGLLRDLIRSIGSVRHVGALLDQCLRDLSAEQDHGDRYFTPEDVARLMVGAAAPQDGHAVLDPVCGSGGLLVESHRHVRELVGARPNLSLRGRDQHAQTAQVARMNLAVRGIAARILPPEDSLAAPEAHPYDVVLANLPFNQQDWAAEAEDGRNDRPLPTDPRWPEEPPTRGFANSAWILHIAHALAPQGRAVFLMPDNVARSMQPAARRLRERLLRDDLVECVVALPLRVLGHSDAPACLWVLNKDKRPRPDWTVLDRRGQVLFVNARRAFEPVPNSRARRLGDQHTESILNTLAAWRGVPGDDGRHTPYDDKPGWSRSCSVEQITSRRHKLMPTSYAVEPLELERDTQSRIDRLKLDLADKLDQAHALELQLLDALEEI